MKLEPLQRNEVPRLGTIKYVNPISSLSMYIRIFVGSGYYDFTKDSKFGLSSAKV